MADVVVIVAASDGDTGGRAAAAIREHGLRAAYFCVSEPPTDDELDALVAFADEQFGDRGTGD